MTIAPYLDENNKPTICYKLVFDVEIKEIKIHPIGDTFKQTNYILEYE